MDPRDRVKTLLRIYEKCLREQSNKDEWRAVKKVRSLYGEYLTPPLTSSFGSIPGVEVGDIFRSRAALALVGLHKQSQAGIDHVDYSDSREGRIMQVAVSVVVSGVYEDDHDEGETLIYTGEGGNDLTKSRKQVKDQKLEGGNLALKHSCELQLPIRVMRARPSDLAVAPSPTVYSYDGLYKVEWWSPAVGISRFRIYTYRLIREPHQAPLKWFRRR